MTEPASIRVRPDGPYVVSGLPVRRTHPEPGTDGEPATWVTEPDLPVPHKDGKTAMAVLCRCGLSAQKPFCDGSHRGIFDGNETAPDTTYDDRAKEYPGVGIVMRDDRSLCEHAGFCATEATTAWKLSHSTDDPAARAQLIDMVERCPSGALTYRLSSAGPDVELDRPAAIGVIDDGPLWVTGSVALQLSDGRTPPARARVTLCRCGHSANKPYCDGSHAEAGFKDSGAGPA